MPAPPRPPRGRCRHRSDGHPGVSPADHRDAPSDPAPGVEGRRGGRGASAVVRPEVTGGGAPKRRWLTGSRVRLPHGSRRPPAPGPLRRRGHAGARWPWWGSHPAAGSTSCSSGAGHPVAGGRLLPAETSMARHPDPVRGMAHRAACDREITWGPRVAASAQPQRTPGARQAARPGRGSSPMARGTARPPVGRHRDRRAPASSRSGAVVVGAHRARVRRRTSAGSRSRRRAALPSRVVPGIRGGGIRGCMDRPQNVIHPTLPSVTPPAYEVPTATRVGVGAFPSES